MESDATTSTYSDLSRDLEEPTEHYDLIHLLAVVQQLDVDILPATWQPALGPIGEGKTARVMQLTVNKQLGLAFKETRTVDETNSLYVTYKELIDELCVLQTPCIRENPNIIDLLGVSFGIRKHTDGQFSLHPALVSRNLYGNLRDFMDTEIGRRLELEKRFQMCLDLAKGLMALHESGA